MNFEKIKEILKNRKVQIIAGTVAGVLLLTVAGTIILNNNNLENKNIVVEKDDKKASNKENNEIKEQLEELKSIDTSNMSDEEKKELENKIADTEKKVANNNSESSEEVSSNTSTSKSNSSSTTISNSGTSNSTNIGDNSNSKPSSGSSSNSNTSNNTGSSSNGSTGGNTTNKEETHTHNWIPITSVVHHEEQGHYEKILVSEAWTEEVPIYEDKEVYICNGCGADITSDPDKHMYEALVAGNTKCAGYSSDWKQVQVGTNKIYHDAIYQDKWIIDKAAWDETVTTGYKCSGCGETK